MLCLEFGCVGCQQLFGCIEILLQMRHLLTERDKDIPCLLSIDDRFFLTVTDLGDPQQNILKSSD